MTKSKIAALGTFGIAVVVAVVVVQQRTATRLAAQNGALQEEIGQLAKAREENAGLRERLKEPAELSQMERRELLRLRAAQAAVIRKADAKPAKEGSEAEPWRQRFEAAYKLRESEMVRHIRAPYIPEREEYYRRDQSQQAAITTNPPTYFVFHQNESGIQNAGYGFVGADHSLEGVLRHVLGLKRNQFDGPEDLLSLPVNGDWTVRDGASPEALLAALEPVLREATGRSIRFEAGTINGEVVTVRGNISPDQNKPIQIYAESNEPSGGGSGDLQKFLDWTGDRLNVSFVNEARMDSPGEFQWADHRDSSFSRMGNRREELTEKVLQNLSLQTSLSFEHERRPVQRWLVREGP